MGANRRGIAGFASRSVALGAAMLAAFAPAHAQDYGNPVPGLAMPDVVAPSPPPASGYAPAEQRQGRPLATTVTQGELTMSAKLTEGGADVSRGLVWRIFGTEPGEDGKLPLVDSTQGGTAIFQLAPGTYLVHAAFGRAGATKRITVGRESRHETLVLEAGGLKLDATIAGGGRVPKTSLVFEIYEGGEDDDRAMIAPKVEPGSVVRLNAGIYHVVSKYGDVNAVIRSDIKVEAGKLTEATVEHKAADVTLKLVRESGSEAIADTSWSVLTNSGDIVREAVGAYAEMVLAEGDYSVVAKNRNRIYQRDFTVVAGKNADVEVIANEANANNAADLDAAD